MSNQVISNSELEKLFESDLENKSKNYISSGTWNNYTINNINSENYSGIKKTLLGLGISESDITFSRDIASGSIALSVKCNELTSQMIKNYSERRGGGLIVEECKFHVLKEVKPEKLCLSRVKLENKLKSQPNIKLSLSISTGATGVPLPSKVYNQHTIFFPPLIAQGQLGSCVAVSLALQATYGIGLLNGISNLYQYNGNVLSPKWVYNLSNFGANNGLLPSDAYSILSQNGIVNINNLPYSTSDYLSWDTNTSDWVSALSNRMSVPIAITGVNLDITAIKTALANGNILTFGTYFNSWVQTKVTQAPIYDPYAIVGNLAISYMNGTVGPHFTTIVGYNDGVGININGSTVMGAFLIANSEGTSYGNNGFVWISYNAFLQNSPNFNPPGRVPIASASNNSVYMCLPKAIHYSPKLIGQFTVSQGMRNQLCIQIGTSLNNTITPSTITNNTCFNYQGGAYSFDGKLGYETATFVLDFTDLIPLGNRFYLIVSDRYIIGQSKTSLVSFKLIDMTTNTTINCTSSFPISGSSTVFVDYQMTGSPTSPILITTGGATGATGATGGGIGGILLKLSEHSSSLDFSIVSPREGEKVTDDFLICLQTKSNFERVEYIIDSTVIEVDENTNHPYYLPYHTSLIPSGKHILEVIVHSGGKTEKKSVNIIV